MRRIALVAIVAVGLAGVLWLAEDGGLQHRLADLGSEVMQKVRGAPPPSWGDVADRVGEFAEEERGLKATVGSLGGGLPEAGDQVETPAAQPLATPE